MIVGLVGLLGFAIHAYKGSIGTKLVSAGGICPERIKICPEEVYKYRNKVKQINMDFENNEGSGGRPETTQAWCVGFE